MSKLSRTESSAHHLCHSLLSVPCTNVSMRSVPQAAASGSDSRTPPNDSQLLQPPSNHLCHSALSVPRTNTSRRFGAHDATAGPDVSTPPNDSQLLQPPSNHLCHSALSVPPTNPPRPSGAHDPTAGPDVSTPPNDSQLLHVIPLPPSCRCLVRQADRRRSAARSRCEISAVAGPAGIPAWCCTVAAAPTQLERAPH